MVLGVPEWIVATSCSWRVPEPNRRNSVPQSRCGPRRSRAGLPGPERADPGLRLRRRFDSPAGSAPDPSKWMIAQARGSSRTRCSGTARRTWASTATTGRTSSWTATPTWSSGQRNDDNRYVSGKLVSTFRTGINHTFEARIQFNCLTAGCWSAWWLLNDNPSGGEVDHGVVRQREWPSGTTVFPRRLDGESFATFPLGVDSNWHRWRCTWNDSGMYFWMDYVGGAEPYFRFQPTRWTTGRSTIQATSWHRPQPRGLVARQ